MKIIYIITRIDEIGGAQIHVLDMAKKMSNNGNKVILIAGGNGDKHFLQEFSVNNIKCYLVKSLKREITPLYDCIALWRIIKILKYERPDIISLHSSKAGFIGRLAGKITGNIVLFTAHGWSFSEGVYFPNAVFYAIAEKLVSYSVKRIINVCHYDKRLALKYKISPAYKLSVIHNGMPDISSDLISKPGNNPCRIIMTARFAPPKNHKLLIFALNQIRDLAWCLDLIGTGPQEKIMKNMVKDFKLDDRINFHGQIHNVAEILSKAHIFVLITEWEGLPRSIIEALRAGLPVIASNVGGVNELVEHKVNGYLVPRIAQESLVMYLRLLINDSALRTRMGNESRKKYAKDFTFKTMYENTVKIYNELTK